MSGSRAKALRRTLPASPFSRAEWHARPALYSHPIDQRPGRKERRKIMRDYDSYLVRATRARNVACARLGIGTPAERITTALKRAGGRWVDEDQDGQQLLPPIPYLLTPTPYRKGGGGRIDHG